VYFPESSRYFCIPGICGIGIRGRVEACDEVMRKLRTLLLGQAQGFCSKLLQGCAIHVLPFSSIAVSMIRLGKVRRHSYGRSTSSTILFMVIVLPYASGAMQFQQTLLATRLDEAREGDVYRFALGFHVRELHSFSDELVVQKDDRAHRSHTAHNIDGGL
jgi:hypothetical protein